MADRLAPGVYAELTRIAEGRGGREPTFAHPDCRCGKPYLPSCALCGAKPNRPCRYVPAFGDWVPPLLPTLCAPRRVRRIVGGRVDARIAPPATREQCPIHRTSNRSKRTAI